MCISVKKSQIIRSAAWAVALVVMVVQAFAQLDTGTISGAVTDQSGAPVPGTPIAITNTQTGVVRNIQTNEAGRYIAEFLPLGTYQVGAMLQGFQPVVRQGIEITVGRNAVIDIAFKVGGVEDTITVAGEVAQIETTTATVSNLVDSKRVLEIPLNNRDLTQLAFFTPGVLRVPLTTSGSFTNTAVGGSGDKITANGARAQQNLYLLDGIPNSDASGNPQSASSAYSGAETIREFQVITNNYSAEYPSVAGAILSAVTKSGVNEFHGSLFEFLRNSAMDASKWEDNAFGNPKPGFRRNQFGGSVGGRIIKDHTFFFVSYEGLRQAQNVTSTYNTITQLARSGGLGPVSASVVPYLALWPLPGQPNANLIQDFGDGRALVAGTARRKVNDDYFFGKLDHQFTGPKHGFLAFTFNRDAADVENRQPLAASGSNVGQTSETELMSVRHTSILSPTMVNEFVAGYTITKPVGAIPISGIDFKNFNGVDLRFNPQKDNMGSINITNVAQVGYTDGATSPGHNQFTIRDGLSLSRGKHSFKLGTWITASRDHIETITTQGNGVYSFTNLQNFLRSRPQTLAINLPDGAPILGMVVQQDNVYNLRQQGYSAYVHDNYSVSPSLTINMGVRYEFLTVPTDTRDHLNSLRSFYANQVVVGPLYKNPTTKAFSPRIGLAWSPGSHKFSLRAGAGIYYEPPSLFSTQFDLQAMFPYGVAGSATDSTSSGNLKFPNAYTLQPQLLASQPQARYLEYDTRSASVYRWSLTLEREFKDWLFTAGYTGSRAEHLLLQFEGNTSKWNGWPNPVPSLQKQFSIANGLMNPAFGRLTVQAPMGNAFYHGLAVNARKRLSRGLVFQGAYTFSKNIDDGASSVNLQDSLAQSVRTIYYADGTLLRGRSAFDIRHSFVSNLTYNFPDTHQKGIVGQIVNGWQSSGVLTLATGFPFSLSDSGNAAQRTAIFAVDGLRPNLIAGGKTVILGGPNQYYDPSQYLPSTCVGTTLCKAGDPNYRTGYLGNLGFDTLVGPGLATLDFSLLKNFKVTESKRFQFRAEFFNLTNRVNFFLPNATPFLSSGLPDPTAGKITSTRTTARQIQMALKFYF